VSNHLRNLATCSSAPGRMDPMGNLASAEAISRSVRRTPQKDRDWNRKWHVLVARAKRPTAAMEPIAAHGFSHGRARGSEFLRESECRPENQRFSPHVALVRGGSRESHHHENNAGSSCSWLIGAWARLSSPVKRDTTLPINTYVLTQFGRSDCLGRSDGERPTYRPLEIYSRGFRSPAFSPAASDTLSD
jgi:hypothetical protein